MDYSEYKDVFAAEAREYIQTLNDNLLQFEENPGNLEVLAEMFRAAHSLKGMAGAMGYGELADFTHRLENVLERLRSGALTATPDVVNLMFESVDALETILEEVIATDEVTTSVEVLAQRLEAAAVGSLESADAEAEHVQEAEAIVLDEYDWMLIREARAHSQKVFHVLTIMRPDVVLKSVRAFTVFQVLDKLGQVVKSVPSAEDLDEERFDDRFSVLLITESTADTVRDSILNISEIVDVVVEEIQDRDNHSPGSDSDKPPKEVSGSASSKGRLSRQGSAQRLESDEPKREAAKGGNQSADRGGSAVRLKARSMSSRLRGSDKFVRVETERLDELIDLIGELVISRTQVVEIAKGKDEGHVKNTIAQLDRVTTELQYAAMKLRMVPVKQVFDRFPRLVRDLAQEMEKQVSFEVVGEETELDRSIVNQVGDPLVHLLRNSIDHGLESPAERKAAGKPEQGRLVLEARHEGSHVVIEVSDDGRGINIEKVKQKAVEKGLITQEEAERMGASEATMLIFEPGFSTADQVTDISGRGVGMDAVKSAIEALNGNVEVESQPGKGTKVRLRLPLTLAIIRALLVVVDGQRLAVPIQSIRENLLVDKNQIKTVHGQPMITLRNEVLPLVDLSKWLGFRPKPSEESYPVIVIQVGDETAGLIVDELVGQQEVVIKSLSPVLGEVKGIAGATVLGDGRVALILETSAVLSSM